MGEKQQRNLTSLGAALNQLYAALKSAYEDEGCVNFDVQLRFMGGKVSIDVLPLKQVVDLKEENPKAGEEERPLHEGWQGPYQH